jgi:hypothetical protein
MLQVENHWYGFTAIIFSSSYARYCRSGGDVRCFALFEVQGLQKPPDVARTSWSRTSRPLSLTRHDSCSTTTALLKQQRIYRQSSRPLKQAYNPYSDSVSKTIDVTRFSLTSPTRSTTAPYLPHTNRQTYPPDPYHQNGEHQPRLHLPHKPVRRLPRTHTSADLGWSPTQDPVRAGIRAGH